MPTRWSWRRTLNFARISAVSVFRVFRPVCLPVADHAQSIWANGYCDICFRISSTRKLGGMNNFGLSCCKRRQRQQERNLPTSIYPKTALTAGTARHLDRRLLPQFGHRLLCHCLCILPGWSSASLLLRFPRMESKVCRKPALCRLRLKSACNREMVQHTKRAVTISRLRPPLRNRLQPVQVMQLRSPEHLWRRQ